MMIGGIARTLGVTMAMTLLAGPEAVAEKNLDMTKTFQGQRLEVRNLIGEVRVESGSGSSFEVVVQPRGAGAREGAIRVESHEGRLDVKVPASETGYVYPALGKGSNTNIDRGLGDLVYGSSGKGEARVRGDGPGLELWADLIVRVPSGGELELRNGVGAVGADGVTATLSLSTNSGDVAIENSTGELEVATGSGNVSLVRDRSERSRIATGSGRITIEDSEGERFSLATGSGGVVVSGLVAQSVEIGVGSGNVRTERLSAEEVEIGSGSGDIAVLLESASEGRIEVGTGSGEIELQLPADASVDLHAETSGGRIEHDLGGRAQITKEEDDELELKLGGGSVRIGLGSGSGNIRIRG